MPSIGRTKELYNRLQKVPNSYEGFIAGIMRYATTSTYRKERVIAYLEQNPYATCSQIVKYVMKQPDFHDAARQTMLENKLYEVPDTYPGFVIAVLNYVSRKIGRVDVVLKFIDENKTANTSDVLEFISNQEDFWEDVENK